MTRKVFWQDPYLSELESRVASVDGARVTLEETIFYALSGGQESDEGSIGGHPVRSAEKRGLDIHYTLDADHGLEPGDAVRIEIDWNRRYRLMRLHFAAEIVLELVYAALPGTEKIGGHTAADKARIDFAMDDNISAHFPALEAAANRIVAADRAVTSAFSDVETERRYWKIDDFDAVPCGGTHIKRTGEIGEIALRRKNIGKGKERIEIRVP